MAPPNWTPSVRDIRKYAPPPLTLIFVAMADNDAVVRMETRLAMVIKMSVFPSPAFPTVYPILKNRMIPRMVKILGVNTPGNIPSL